MEKEKSNFFKKFTKKQKIIFITAVVMAIAVITLSIVLPIVLLRPTVFLPEVSSFDQENDAYIKIVWNKVSKADKYIIEYYYDQINEDESNLYKANTQSQNFSILRRKGVLAYRVGYSKNNKNTFSEWKYYNVHALGLGTTANAVINNEGVLSWSKVRYYDKQTVKDVPAYTIEFKLEGELVSGAVSNRLGANTNYSDLKIYIKGAVKYNEKVDTWSDISINVKIKALNYYTYGNFKVIDGDYEYLYSAYDEGIFYETKININYQQYKAIIA